MSDTHEDHEREARELLASRVADMREFLDFANYEPPGDFDINHPDEETRHEARLSAIRRKLADDVLDGYEDASEAVSNYGLSWEKETTNHRYGTVTYAHVLSTGGPHDEFQVTFDPDSGKVDSVKFVYLPWFDRVEIDEHTATVEQASTVVDFYETFYGDLVVSDNYETRGER